LRHWWIMALCLMVGCSPAGITPGGTTGPSPVASRTAVPSSGPSAVAPSPAVSAQPSTDVKGRALLNNRPCCDRAYRTVMVGATIVATVVHCPAIPTLVGREYTLFTDSEGKYLLTGLPQDTAVKLRLMSHQQVERHVTVGTTTEEVDLVVEGPACSVALICPTTIRGTVFDGAGAPIDGVTITARIVTTEALGDRRFDGNSSDTVVTATVAGGFAIDGVPAGATIQISAGKAGYRTRQKTIRPQSNVDGPPAANDVTFGKDLTTGALDSASALVLEPPSASTSPTMTSAR
jgi:hypothetical protein